MSWQWAHTTPSYLVTLFHRYDTQETHSVNFAVPARYVASAKEDSNITEAVESLTAKILQNHREQVVALADKNPGGVVGTGTPGTATKINLHEDEGACRVGPRGKCCG